MNQMRRFASKEDLEASVEPLFTSDELKERATRYRNFLLPLLLKKNVLYGQDLLPFISKERHLLFNSTNVPIRFVSITDYHKKSFMITKENHHAIKLLVEEQRKHPLLNVRYIVEQ